MGYKVSVILHFSNAKLLIKLWSPRYTQVLAFSEVNPQFKICFANVVEVVGTISVCLKSSTHNGVTPSDYYLLFGHMFTCPDWLLSFFLEPMFQKSSNFIPFAPKIGTFQLPHLDTFFCLYSLPSNCGGSIIQKRCVLHLVCLPAG